MRIWLTVLFCVGFSGAVGAVEAPAEQIHVDATKILRGQFTEDHQTNNATNPMHASGHFVVAPGHGVIWGIEQPFPTTTIITPNAAAQDFGGLAVKLPAKNLRHLYDMVGGALAGDWSALENDFVITHTAKGGHWHMLLTPRTDGKAKLPYSAITVSGSHFVENIMMAKTDGTYDAFDFTNTTVAVPPLTAQEIALFGEVK